MIDGRSPPLDFPVQHRHYDTIDSTNDQAMALAQQGQSLPLLVSATTQTGGRGRLGRNWQSPFGGAWFTLAYQEPKAIDQPTLSLVPLAAAAAIWQTIADMAEVMGDRSLAIAGPSARLLIKWPNDLLVDGGKVAGILCQRTIGASVGIIGIGINVNNDPQKLGPVRLPAMSLKQSVTGEWDVSALIHAAGDRLVEQLDRLWSKGLTSDWGHWFEQRMAYVGQPVTWDEQGERCHGECLGLNHGDDSGGRSQSLGGLLVRLPGGAIRVLVGHEVDHLASSK